jgi:acetylglutamate synthase
MARTAVTVSKMLVYNAKYAITPVAVDLTNDHVIDASEMAHDRLLIRVAGGTTEMTITVKAGAFSDASLGDEVLTIGATDIVCIVLETSRFLQSDGTINIDAASGGLVTDATIEAYLLP